MTAMTKRLIVGGLMRCCTGSMAYHMEQPDYSEGEGFIVHCAFCDSSMIYKGGVWRWNLDEEKGDNTVVLDKLAVNEWLTK